MTGATIGAICAGERTSRRAYQQCALLGATSSEKEQRATSRSSSINAKVHRATVLVRGLPNACPRLPRKKGEGTDGSFSFWTSANPTAREKTGGSRRQPNSGSPGCRSERGARVFWQSERVRIFLSPAFLFMMSHQWLYIRLSPPWMPICAERCLYRQLISLHIQCLRVRLLLVIAGPPASIDWQATHAFRASNRRNLTNAGHFETTKIDSSIFRPASHYRE